MINNGEKTELCYNKELMKYHDCHLLSGKLYCKLSKPREGLLASVTSASTKAEERGITRSGEGARWSALRPLALSPV